MRNSFINLTVSETKFHFILGVAKATTTTSNVTTVTKVRSTSACLFASMWRSLASVITTLYYVANIIFLYRRVRYHALSLCYVCIRSLGIILIPRLPLCQILFLFAASIAELAHGEKSRTQSLNHPDYLMPWEPKHLHFGTTK